MWRCLKGSGKVPTGRSSHGLSAVGNKLYVFGGEHEPRVPLPNDLHRFSINEKTWEVLNMENQPPEVIACTLADIGSKLYLFGGRTGLMMGDGDTNDLFCFDTEKVKWDVVDAGGDIPAKRSYHAMVSCCEKLYVFGGCTAKGRSNDLHCFDTNTNTWERQPTCDAITPRGGPGLVAVKNMIFVVGGFDGEEETSDMYEYNTSSKSWRELKPVPNIPAISVFAINSIGSKIVVFGGEVSPSELGHAGAGGFSNDVYVYDTESEGLGWVKVEVRGDIPSARGWLSATATDGEFFIFGGNLKSNDRANDLYALSL